MKSMLSKDLGSKTYSRFTRVYRRVIMQNLPSFKRIPITHTDVGPLYFHAPNSLRGILIIGASQIRNPL